MQKKHYVRQVESGYCAPGCVAILVSLADPTAIVDQKQLVKKHAKYVNDWGVTNNETLLMAREFFSNVSSQEHTTWNEVKIKLDLGYGIIIDFYDDTVFTDGSPSAADGHDIVIMKVDQENKIVTIIDPTDKPKVFDYQNQEYVIYDQAVDVPLLWLEERWHDQDINGQLVICWAMFVDLKSYLL